MKKQSLPLSELNLGEEGVVDIIVATDAEKRRFWDLGLIRGTTVKALHKSPSGNPIAYSILGAVIALRNYDAGKVFVRICDNIISEHQCND